MSIAELKEELKKNKPILGARQVLNMLLNKELHKIYLAFNCNNKEKIINLGKMNDIEIIKLQESSKQIGAVCKKSFPVSAIGFK